MTATATTEPYGRIRLREQQARIYHDLLLDARRALLAKRRAQREAGESYTELQRAITMLDEMFDELNRLFDEQGWRSA